MKFAHLGDCHVGGWHQPELNQLNFQSFQSAISTCIKEKVDFVIIAGDLFDSAYPPIDILKETFSEFRKLKEASIPVYLIAGSHDYSISGKTFLDVLEKAGFCQNIAKFEEHNEKIMLQPTIHKNIALYGYPGKKSALEVGEIEKIKLQDAPGLFKILVLHTAIKDALPNLPIKCIDEKALPKVNYLALAHLHINYNKDGRVYSGPIFPNDLAELEELKYGSFYIFEDNHIKKQEIKLKEIQVFNVQIKNTITATDEIIKRVSETDIKDRIVILKLSGTIEQGKITDINFAKIEQHAKNQGAFIFLKTTSKLYLTEPELHFDVLDTEHIESKIISQFKENQPSKFNEYIPHLIRSLQLEKLDDETSNIFEERLLSEVKKVIKYET